jgi:Na+/H+ antiporter NhaD/arsenite permease-like protein
MLRMCFSRRKIIIFFIPFLTVILGLAIGPLLFPRLWHRMEKVFLFLSGAGGILVLCYQTGISKTFQLTLHMLTEEYIPFALLMTVLFMISHGIQIHFQGPPTPLINSLFLGLGSFLASLIGTAGASLILFRPYLHLNQSRKYRVHQVIFFIFLVSNLGGCLTPFGDPPLFLGFLKGVPFFWPLQHLWKEWLWSIGWVLVFFGIVDRYYFRLELSPVRKSFQFHWSGGVFVLFLVLLLVLMGTTSFLPITKIGPLPLNQWVQIGGMISLIGLCFGYYRWKRLPQFSYLPLQEVLSTFIVLFITLIPVVQCLTPESLQWAQPILKPSGILNPKGFFLLTGLLSSFLDNAPTYLLFFEIGGKLSLLHQAPRVLVAISLGAVFMGAMTYIGNAPNLMIRSIASGYQIPLPGFLGYIKWSILWLGPVLVSLVWLFL